MSHPSGRSESKPHENISLLMVAKLHPAQKRFNTAVLAWFSNGVHWAKTESFIAHVICHPLEASATRLSLCTKYRHHLHQKLRSPSFTSVHKKWQQSLQCKCVTCGSVTSKMLMLCKLAGSKQIQQHPAAGTLLFLARSTWAAGVGVFRNIPECAQRACSSLLKDIHTVAK